MNGHHDHKKHNETAMRILNAAKDIFAEVGLAGARMDEIANRAGVNKATIYYHIGDKKALYAEVIHQVIGSAYERISQNVQGSQTPEQKIRSYVFAVAEAMDKNPQMPAIMLREMASGGQNLPNLVIDDFARIISIIAGIVKEGIDKKVFAETIPMVVHFMVVGAFSFYKTSAFIRSRHEGLPEEIRKLDEHLSGQIAGCVAEMMVKALKKADQGESDCLYEKSPLAPL